MEEKVNIADLIDGAREEEYTISEPKSTALPQMEKLRDFSELWTMN